MCERDRPLVFIYLGLEQEPDISTDGFVCRWEGGGDRRRGNNRAGDFPRALVALTRSRRAQTQLNCQ